MTEASRARPSAPISGSREGFEFEAIMFLIRIWTRWQRLLIQTLKHTKTQPIFFSSLYIRLVNTSSSSSLSFLFLLKRNVIILFLNLGKTCILMETNFFCYNNKLFLKLVIWKWLYSLMDLIWWALIGFRSVSTCRSVTARLFIMTKLPLWTGSPLCTDYWILWAIMCCADRTCKLRGKSPTVTYFGAKSPTNCVKPRLLVIILF